MACRVALPSPAERFSGEGRPFAPAGQHLLGNGEHNGRRRPSASEGHHRLAGRPSTACCVTEGEGHVGCGFSRAAARFLSCRGMVRRLGERRVTPDSEGSLRKSAAARRVKEKSLFKEQPARSAAPERRRERFADAQGGIFEASGQRPGARRQASSSLRGRSISSRTAAAGSAFS